MGGNCCNRQNEQTKALNTPSALLPLISPISSIYMLEKPHEVFYLLYQVTYDLHCSAET